MTTSTIVPDTNTLPAMPVHANTDTTLLSSAVLASDTASAVAPAVAQTVTAQGAAPSKATPNGESPAQSARALLKQLQTRFPAFRDCLPLAIGVDKQLHAAMPELNRKILRIALGIHTNSLRYLRVMEKAAHRYDLAGVQADEVSDAHRKHASEILRERFKKDAEQRKALKAAADAEKAAVEAARIHAEKLSLLSEKFSRKK